MQALQTSLIRQFVALIWNVRDGMLPLPGDSRGVFIGLRAVPTPVRSSSKERRDSKGASDACGADAARNCGKIEMVPAVGLEPTT